MLYHIILGLGRAWKGIEMYQEGHYIIDLHFNTEGHALPKNYKYCNVLKGMSFVTLVISRREFGRAWKGIYCSDAKQKCVWIVGEGFLNYNFGRKFLKVVRRVFWEGILGFVITAF